MFIKKSLRLIRIPRRTVRLAMRHCQVTRIMFVIMLATILLLNTHNKSTPIGIILPRSVEISMYQLIQPDVFEDFPTVPDGAPKIPHIIHQTSNSTCIPEANVEYVKTFLNLNPDWEYYFWTDKSARDLIRYRYPDLLKMWDNIDKGIKKADILRYVVLYEYGGVYADEDVENLKPLDRVTRKYSCIIPTEPFEHGAFLYMRPFIINNGIMLCRRRHPFFKQLLNNLKHTINNEVMTATGPLYVTEEFIKYNKYMHQNENGGPPEDFTAVLGPGAYEETDEDAVYVPNTHFFTDTIDTRIQGRNFSETCKMFWLLGKLRQGACIDLFHKGLHRKNTQFAYTSHHWYHSWCTTGKTQELRDSAGCVHINRIVPHERLTMFGVTETS